MEMALDPASRGKMLVQLISSKGFEKFGLNVNGNGDITYREWAPNAIDAHLIGDFSSLAPIFSIHATCLGASDGSML